MRLIWQKYDSAFDPIVTLVGLGFFIGGAYGVSLLAGAVVRHPVVAIIAAVPLIMAIVGVLTLLREYQLWVMAKAGDSSRQPHG
ncbi:MAG TPA: hypothetical protein VFU76_09780 [Terriglobales bacterium]|nr:hypothetical protein [Terriglobales bacterium]